MERDELLKRIRSTLEDAFGERLQGVVLYGSEARGDAEPDSDIDLLVLLTGPIDFDQDLRMCIHVLYSLVLEIERPIDVFPVDAEEYQSRDIALYVNAKKEGILA